MNDHEPLSRCSAPDRARGNARAESWALLGVLFLLAAPARVEATPGTPIPEPASAFHRPADDLPMIAIRFRNTASEAVRFHMEWTADGQRLPFPGDQVDCGETITSYCAHGYYFGSRARHYEHKRDKPYSMLIKDVAFDTQYCFRFTTEDDDGVWAQLWSGWVCTRTPAAPAAVERPAAGPKQVQLTLLPGNSDRGAVGGAIPDRLLVEWTPGGPGADRYVIETKPVGRPYYERVHDANLQAQSDEGVITLGDTDRPDRNVPILVRVCAVNRGGATCSPARRFPPMPVAMDARPRLTQPEVNMNERAGSMPRSDPPATAAPAAAPADGSAVTGAVEPAPSPGPSVREQPNEVPVAAPKAPNPPRSLDRPAGLRPRP